jgi:subtilisin-like proprotein convertase family protein
MQNNTTFKMFTSFLQRMGMFVLIALSALSVNSQTISTAGGTNYTNGFGVNNPASQLQTFVIQNTNATAVVLNSFTMVVGTNGSTPAGTPSTVRLWVSTTSLSGVPTVSTPDWTQIGSGSFTVPTVATELPMISGLSFVIPANTQYRFAVEATRGLRFSVTPLPTPNTFTVGGVSLKLGDLQIAGANIGFAGLMPTPAAGNTPTFFGGSVTLSPFVACSGTPAPGNTLSTVISACPTDLFTLSLQNATAGSNLVYEWQTASAVGGPYATVAGQTSATYNVTGMSATTFYRARVACGANSTFSTPVQVTSRACYCASNATSAADTEVLNVTFGSLNNTSNCTAVAPGPGSLLNRYGNYTGYVGAPVANVLTGIVTPLSVQVGTCGGFFGSAVAVWIDYDQDGVFAATERVYVSAATSNVARFETANILIPVTATAGVTRMRVVLVETAPANISACGTYTYGETEDYNVNIVVPTPCTGTPNPGNTLSTQSAVCSGATGFSLSLQNNPPNSGLTYQWFSGPSATGPWTAVTGATNPTLSVASITTATFYYATVTCAGNTSQSTPVGVTIRPVTQCYCPSTATNSADEDIFRVTLGTLNNVSTCATLAPGPGSLINRYSNYQSGTGAPTPPSIAAGETLPLQVQIGTCGGNFTNSVAVFIDYNQDGTYQATERAYVSATGTTGPHVEGGNITIPGNAVVGLTGMRVVNVETGAPLSINACGTYTWGETEDYLVNITPCIPLTLVTPPASKSAVCGSESFLSTVITGTGRVYQWQVQTTPGGAWTNLTNTGGYTGATADTLRINPVATGMNGYNYRVVYSGGCTSVTFTSSATLTVTPIVATVTPTSAALCLGGTQQLTITNISSPQPFSQTFSSGVLALAIADGNVTGVNNTISIPAGSIPAGASVTNITVAVNVPHTYVSDLMVVVKGPNNAILNLSNLIGGGNNPGANFTNTRFSSLSTLPLASGTAPGYTNVFRADGAGAVGAFGVPGGPTGFTPTLPGGSLSAFHAQPNGNWTIAMYDAGPPDVGTLTGWSVKIDYVLGTPATGVYSGPAGTIFTDAAATTAYTGTPINSVFVKPLAGGVNNYSVVVTDGACSSNPVTIPVTVNQLPSSLGTVANQTICEAGNVTLTATPVGGAGFASQWQVSTDNGTTFTNIANGGVYSGATTNSLTITGAPVSLNGYRYRLSVTAAPCVGSVTSTAATLTVNPKPVVTISVAPLRNLFPGLSTTLTAAASPNPVGAAYQWFRNGTAVAGATSNKYVVNIDRLGTYSIRVTDVNGCVAAAGSSTPSSIAIGDSANLTTLFIYPSPNNGQFQVRYFNDVINNGLVPGIVNVYDSKGARVFSKSFTVGGGYQPMNVDLGPSHGRGIYRVDLLTSRGERIKTGTVIVM